MEILFLSFALAGVVVTRELSDFVESRGRPGDGHERGAVCAKKSPLRIE